MRAPYILSYLAGASNPPIYLTLTITGVSDAIMEIFEVTGFSDILNIV